MEANNQESIKWSLRQPNTIKFLPLLDDKVDVDSEFIFIDNLVAWLVKKPPNLEIVH